MENGGRSLTAAWSVLRAEARRRWRSWLALVFLVTVVGGFVLAATAAGRRTASAFPRYETTYGIDLLIYGSKPLDLAKLPEVSSVVSVGGPANGDPRCACRHTLSANGFSVFEVAPSDLPRFAKLVSGRYPNQSDPHEVLASYTLAGDEGLHLGSVVRVPLESPSQGNGPTVALRIVGFSAAEVDFPSVGTPSYAVIVTSAFDREVNPHVLMYSGYAVRLRRGAADVPLAVHDATTLGAQGFGDQEAGRTVTDGIHPQAVGWYILALLGAVGGAVAVAQALARQSKVEAERTRTLVALGMGRGGLVAVGLGRAAIIGAAGAAGSALLAFALSPIAPMGEARVAEPANGLAFDGLVLVGGAAAVLAAVVLLGLVPALRAATPARSTAADGARGSAVVNRLLAWGAPPTAVIGVRRAVDRGRGPGSVPVGNALVGAAVAVAALCGTAVFGASLHQLTSTPRLYGQAFQMWMSGNGPGPDAVAGPEARLAADHTVTDLTLGVSGSTVINGVATDSIGGQPVKGRLLIIPTKGRDPVAPDEVALGVKTMQAVGAHIGSTVKVNVPLAEGGGGRKSPFRVVGEVSFPADFGVVGLGRGAVFTIDGLVGAQCPLGTAGAPCRQTLRSQLSYVLLAGVQPGPAGRAAVASYIRRYPDQATLPVVPARLVNFGQAVDFPLILAVLVAVFGAASLIHVLVVSVGRRRREVGLLKALGFVRPQVIATVGWQATTVALVGVAIGVPAGLAGGRAVWRAFAVNLGFVPVPVISPGVIALIAAGVVVAVNVLAVGPAVASASMPAAVALRTE